MSAKKRKYRSNATLEERISRMYACRNSESCAVAPLMAACVNCRLGVEAAQSRVYARRLRGMRHSAECSSARCVAFIDSLPVGTLKTHLASMAWWRFSLAPEDPCLSALARVMRDEPISDIPFGDEYMHSAIRALAACTPEQLMTWFGHENPYQIATFYSGRCGACGEEHCQTCVLLHRGCTQSGTPAAATCGLWADEAVQRAFASAPVSAGSEDPE